MREPNDTWGVGVGAVLPGGAGEQGVDVCRVMAWYARVMLSLVAFLPARACRVSSSEGARSGAHGPRDDVPGLQILVLGLGGGIIPTHLLSHLPNAHVHVVELLHGLAPVARR